LVIPVKRSRAVGYSFEIRIVRREKPGVVRIVIVVPISADEDISTRLAVQELKHSRITIIASRARLDVDATDRRWRCTFGCGPGSARTLRVNANPEPTGIVKEVVNPQGKWRNIRTAA